MIVQLKSRKVSPFLEEQFLERNDVLVSAPDLNRQRDYEEKIKTMLGDPSGYVRIRGIRLIAANARWAEEERLKAVLPELLGHILDPKPIVARQCIACLPEIAAGCPALAAAINDALRAADPSCYADSMHQTPPC